MDFVNSKNEPYMEQLCRVRRLHGCVLANFDFSKNNISENDLTRIDMILSFFMHCYHLRDWLVESRVVKSDMVDNFINNSYEMSICRNLCLGAKHLKITKPSKPQLYQGVNTPIGRSYDPFDNKINLTVSVDGEEINYLNLATKCLNQWEEFIKKNVK